MRIPWPALIPAMAVVIFTGSVVLWTALSHFRFLTFHRSEHKKPPPLGFVGWLMFYGRTLRSAFLLLWWFFRGAFQAGLRIPRVDRAGRPVLCVHGLFMNSTCMWGIRRTVERLGRPTRAVFLGVPFPTPAVCAGPLTTVMREMAEAFPDEGFDVVAHSLGGVMVREVVADYPDLALRVRRLVTLGSPHRGTAFLRWMRFGPIYQMLRRDSTYLGKLPDLQTSAPQAEVTTVATLHDLVVYPTAMAHLPGARQITLSGISHLGLMTETRVMEVIRDALERETT